MYRVRVSLLVAALAVAAIAAADDVTINTAPRSIDVIVTDNHGNHITNLEPAEFQIFEDGVARNVTKVIAVTRAADGVDVQPQRSILLVFDETSISLPARRTTVNSLRTFINTRVR